MFSFKQNKDSFSATRRREPTSRSPQVVNKSVLPLLVLPLVVIATLELLLEVAEHALGVACSGRVDQVLHGIGQQVMLHAGAWERPTAHTWRRERGLRYQQALNRSAVSVLKVKRHSSYSFCKFECSK